MKRGDLCKFVGRTTGWGTFCVVVEVNVNIGPCFVVDKVRLTAVKILCENGAVRNIGPQFLEVIKINNGDNSPQT